MAHAGVDRCERVRYSEFGVVMRMNPPHDLFRCCVGGESGACILHDLSHAAGEGAAIGVAENERRGAGITRSAQRVKRVIAICLKAIEEVLGVIDQLATAVSDVGDALRDHREIFSARCLKDRLHVQGPALAEDRDNRCLGIEECIQIAIVPGLVRLMARAAECGEAGALPANLLRCGEELDVLRVGAWPPTLDRQHAELVKRACDAQLVL